MELEFGGVWGTAILPPFLLSVQLLMYYSCTSAACLELSRPLEVWTHTIVVPSIPEVLQATQICLIWLLFMAFLYYVAPGRKVLGSTLKSGHRLEYPINASASAFIAWTSWGLLCFYEVISPTYLYEHYVAFIFASTAIALIISIGLYLKAICGKNIDIADPGNSGYFIYDFFMGRELNPRIAGLDLKYFCEIRPGLIGWILVNASMAAKQLERTGTIKTSMLLVNIFEALYVIDCLVFEECILTTRDITTDGFGYMLVFGDLSWVPFMYTHNSRYLADLDYDPLESRPLLICLILVLKLVGYWIFRSSNAQKDLFRSNPNHPRVKNLKYIKTSTGSLLLCSGWWGKARHINYLGDLMMGLAWCMCSGFNNFLPSYFYIVYFIVLLVHREWRDDIHCHHKYGKDWEKYRKMVPYRILPRIY